MRLMELSQIRRRRTISLPKEKNAPIQSGEVAVELKTFGNVLFQQVESQDVPRLKHDEEVRFLKFFGHDYKPLILSRFFSLSFLGVDIGVE